VANLKIEGIDNKLYKELERIGGEEKRLVRKQARGTKSTGQALLDLSGSWEDGRKPEVIISRIRKARKNLKKLKGLNAGHK
jgi:hypothetical protein